MAEEENRLARIERKLDNLIEQFHKLENTDMRQEQTTLHYKPHNFRVVYYRGFYFIVNLREELRRAIRKFRRGFFDCSGRPCIALGSEPTINSNE
jgi:uncharacterized protein YheU (UPF0270 family)